MLHQGSCHCGKIAYEVEGDFTMAIDCNCSLCRKRGSLLAFVGVEDFTLKTAEDDLQTYTFNAHKIQHHFCGTCGVAPFSKGVKPDGTPMRAINLRCIPEIDLDGLKIHKWDGASH